MKETYGRPKEYYEIKKEEGNRRTIAFMDKAIKDSVEEMFQNPTYVTKKSDMESGLDPYVVYQFFYSPKTQKSFIQFNIYNHNKNSIVNCKELQTRITGKINAQFKYDTRIDAEILNRDQKKVVPDNRLVISPYAIGYWKSLDQIYDVIEDRSYIYLDYKNIWTLPDKKRKRLDEFYNTVFDICKRYNLFLGIDKENIDDYIADYYEILKETHGEGDYNERIAELNELYEVSPYDNSKIPEAMEEYSVAYSEFFESELPEIDHEVEKHIMVIRIGY